MNEFQEQFDWQRSLIPQVIQILKFNASKFFDVSEATIEQDTKCATDLVLKVHGGDIALRLRKDNCKFRDFTVRAENLSYKTEIDKIREGFARWYFYGWVDKNKIISEWILIDLNQFRNSKLINIERDLISNFDGTSFYAYTLDELFHCRCLLAYELNKISNTQLSIWSNS